MKNLKKVLALVVAVAMFASFACVASAASYTDVASTASYADAVNLLSNLGVINGFEDGTFRPEETVTRAQAAKMIVCLLGEGDDVTTGDTQFTDVDGSHWASGYINVAVARGILNGMGDGTFAPEATLTYGQIVKMIVCALGYEPVAQSNGGWAGGGYIVAGSKAGFTKGVSGTADAAASRATVAVLMYNALEVELMDQTSYSTGIYGDQYEILEGKTILTEYLELEKVEGVVVETYLSNVDEYEEGVDTVKLVVTKNTADEPSYEVGDTVIAVADATSAATLLGYSVVAYVGENEDGDDEIFAIAEKSGKNSTLVLDTEDIVEIVEDEEEDGVYNITYWKSSKSTATADIETFVKWGKGEDDKTDVAYQVVNGFNVYEEAADILDVYEALEEITLLDNDGDGDFEFIFATVLTDNAIEFLVTEVEVEDEFFTVVGEDESFDIDYEDADVLYTVIKDGAIVDASAIAENDVVTILDSEASIVTVYVSSVVVEGTVEEVEEDEYYTINGAEYKVSPINEISAPEAGDEGLFYINATGKIAYIDATSSSEAADYVYVIDASESEGDFGEMTYLVKVVTAKGEIEVLTIKSKKCIIDGEKNFTDDEVFEAVDGYVGLAKIDTTTAGELSAIYFPAEEDGEFVADDRYVDENEVEYKEARGRYGVLTLATDALVFHIDTTEVDSEGEIDYEEAVTVSTVAGIFVDGNSYKFTAYGEDDEDPVVLVVTDAKTSVDAEAPVMVVTKVSRTTADDETTVKLTGIVAGATETVIVDPDEDLTIADFEKADIILYAMNAGYATDVQVLYNADGLATELEDILVDELSDEDVTVHYGELTEVESKSFFLDDEDEFFFGDDFNVTVVDLTGNGASIAKGSKSSVKASANKYTRYAFVKTELESEDVVTDIVVFVTK